MIIAAKSIIGSRDLQDKFNKGAEHVELHLVREDFNQERTLKDKVKVLQQSNLQVVVVHTPIRQEYNLEGLNTSEGKYIINKTCELANKMGEIQGGSVHVVVHAEHNLRQLQDYGMIREIDNEIRNILENYKFITLNIENLTMVGYNQGNFVLRNTHQFSTVELCKFLRKELETERIGTVLDTCHALSTIYSMRDLVNNGIQNTITLEDYIEVNLPYMNVMHLANSIGYGMGEDHGVPFVTTADVKVLEDVIEQLLHSGYNRVVTIEMVEEDYLNSVNFERAFKQVRRIEDRFRESRRVG